MGLFGIFIEKRNFFSTRVQGSGILGFTHRHTHNTHTHTHTTHTHTHTAHTHTPPPPPPPPPPPYYSLLAPLAEQKT
jgi:hypothetical protein